MAVPLGKEGGIVALNSQCPCGSEVTAGNSMIGALRSTVPNGVEIGPGPAKE